MEVVEALEGDIDFYRKGMAEKSLWPFGFFFLFYCFFKYSLHVRRHMWKQALIKVYAIDSVQYELQLCATWQFQCYMKIWVFEIIFITVTYKTWPFHCFCEVMSRMPHPLKWLDSLYIVFALEGKGFYFSHSEIVSILNALSFNFC